MIKLIALDIDGTILNTKGEISQKTKDTIERYQKKGVLFTLASGRAFYMLRSLLQEIKINAPIICYNGSVIQQPYTKEILHESFLSENFISCLIQQIKEVNNLKLNLYLASSKGLFIEEGSELEKVFSHYIKYNKPKDIKKYVKEHYGEKKEALSIMLSMYEDLNVEIVKKLKDIEKGNIVQASLNFEIYQKEKVMELLNKIINKEAGFATTAENNFDIFSKGYNKGVGLKILCEKMGFRREEVAAIGNEYNDLEMLQFSGIGVAMGNSPKAIKEKADMVVGTNDEEGVSEAIEKLIEKSLT